MAAFGCASGTELQTVESHLADLQLNILQLRQEAATGEEVRAIAAALDEQSTALLRAHADSRLEVERLATQVEQLEAKLEDARFRLTQVSQELAASQQELQTLRIAHESASNRPPAGVGSATGGRSPQEIYDAAYEHYLAGNFDLAILGFREFVEDNGSHPLADNATYWVGESYYRQGKFSRAIDQFDEVVLRYATGDRIPSSLLKKGYAHLELGQRAQGVVLLQNVVCEHGSTDEAQLARQRLGELGVDVDC